MSLRSQGGTPRALAVELNAIIRRESPAVWEMLSSLGRRLFFPKGILAQSAEAKAAAYKYDATIGIAREDGGPMHLPTVMSFFNDLTPAEVLTYAPATGQPALRAAWHEHLLAENPSLQDAVISMPVVTSGVTHALSIVCDLFVDDGDFVLLPDKFWENYELLFGVRVEAHLATYPFFGTTGGFNVEALRQALAARPRDSKTLLVLNFPNNPTGYSVTTAEATAIVAVLQETAERGCRLVVVSDDAYFGLYYGEDVYRESLFARLANLHENILAIKVDGPTKEEYVWGFRMGMLTFGVPARTDAAALFGALEQKVAGAIRGAVSTNSQPAQSILLKSMHGPNFAAEIRQKKAVLEARALKVKELLRNPDYAELWEAYPFNAGYFMCLRLTRTPAETYRKYLLAHYGIGVIATGDHDIRVAFSAVDLHELEELYDTLATAARELLVESQRATVTA